jgi:hypothetical protein
MLLYHRKYTGGGDGGARGLENSLNSSGIFERENHIENVGQSPNMEKKRQMAEMILDQ